MKDKTPIEKGDFPIRKFSLFSVIPKLSFGFRPPSKQHGTLLKV